MPSVLSSKSTNQLWVFKPTDPIEQHYKLGRRLGQPGQFGYAVLATHRKSGMLNDYIIIIYSLNHNNQYNCITAYNIHHTSTERT